MNTSSLSTLCFAFSIFLSANAATTYGQITAKHLIGTSVETVDERYRDIDDAIVLFGRGNGAGALALLQAAKQKNPELPPGEVLFAHLCFASGNAKTGHEILQRAVLADKTDPEPWNMLADLQLRNGHVAEAVVLFDKALDLAKTYQGSPKRQRLQLANAYAGAALANERQGEWAAAEVHLRDWIKLDPENAEILPRLAATLINTKRFDEAKATLEQYRKLDSKQLPAEAALGLTYQRLGMNEEAEKSMKEALQKYGDDFGTRIAVARWALEANQLTLARECATKAASLDKDSPLPTLVQGMADFHEGKYAQAEKLFRQITDNNPSNYDATNGLAMALLAQNDEKKLKQAVGYAEVNAKGNNDLRTPRGRQSAAVLAWALHHDGKAEDAVRLIQSTLTSGQVSPEIGYFAAVILADAGNKELAREVLSRSLETNLQFVHRKDAEAFAETLK